MTELIYVSGNKPKKPLRARFSPAFGFARFAFALLIIALFAGSACAEQITVCVLDSGCNIEGAAGWNYVSDTPDLTDNVGHGTRVYSLIAAAAPDARVVMLKCFDASTSFDGAAAIRALYDAIDVYDADIINMSWTYTECDVDLHEAIAYAYEHGATLIAPAGNLSFETGLGAVVYPAAWDEVIGVAGVDIDDSGEPAGSLWYLAGESVYVCARADCEGERGSSFAAARISGFLAAYKEEPADAATSARILREAAEDIGDTGYDIRFGWGYIRTAQ